MSDRLKSAWEAINGALLRLATYVRWEYRVQGVVPGPPVLISATPAGASPFGNLANITLWPGPSGAYALPPVGSLVLVEFHEGDPSKPSICGLDPAQVPTLTTLGGGTAPIARVGDTVTMTPAQFAAGLPVAPSSGGAVTSSVPMQATITSGSAKVVSG
jgi:hypothetical protein